MPEGASGPSRRRARPDPTEGLGVTPFMTSTSPDLYKILVIGPSWVGDMVIAQTLFRTLVHAGDEVGEVQIDLVAPPWSSPVATRMPEVRRIHQLAVPHGVLGLGKRRHLARQLRAQRYDRAIVIPRTLKSALIPYWAKIPHRTGYRGEHRYLLINDMRALDKELLRSTAERYCALGPPRDAHAPNSMPPPRLAVDETNRLRLVDEFSLDTTRPVVALCPGAAFGPSKRWPIDRFITTANLLAETGYAIWILGSPSEADLGRAITEAVPSAVNLCGKSQLVDAIDLLSLAQVTVTNDSGLLHIGAAVGSRIVALYGSTPPWFAPPLTERKRIHYTELACSPCFKKHCPLGHHDCMKRIAPADVVADVIEWVGNDD